MSSLLRRGILLCRSYAKANIEINLMIINTDRLNHCHLICARASKYVRNERFRTFLDSLFIIAVVYYFSAGAFSLFAFSSFTAAVKPISLNALINYWEF
jgi:hypothetical protein